VKDFRLKLIFIVSFLFSISCTNNKNTAINILYLFDISGSYHKKSLKESLEISSEIFNEIIGSNGVPFKPQTHQVSTIESMSVSIGGNCYTRIIQDNIFDEQKSNPTQQFENCLKKIHTSKPTNATDLKGALATASKTLQNDELRGKGVIIFSDLHESLNTKRSYPINLENVCVYVIYEWSDYQIANPQLITEDENSFRELLIQSGVNPNDIEMKNISTVATNPEMVSNWFRKKF